MTLEKNKSQIIMIQTLYTFARNILCNFPPLRLCAFARNASLYILASFLFYAGCNSGADKTTLSGEGQFNILLITVDDLRSELGCYGNREIISPNIDKLASKGVIFRRMYCQAPLCMPSRSSFLSGVRPEHFQPDGALNANPIEQNNIPGPTMPQHFKNNGYQTVSVGKVYHHAGEDEKGWTRLHDESYATEKVGGLGYASGYQKKENQEATVTYMKAWSDTSLMNAFRPPSFEISDAPDSLYPDGRITNLALSELRSLASDIQPFLLGVGYYRPHLPFTPPGRYWDMYNPMELDTANNPFLPVNGLGFHSMNELRRYGDIPRYGPISKEKGRQLKHGYYASVTYIDDQIGLLMKEVKNLELERSTIIVVLGDHGWQLGEHGMWGKEVNYDLANRTVMLIKVPGKDSGFSTNALSGLIDLFPTLCELTGIPVPETAEGISLKPVIEGKTDQVQEQIFTLLWNSYSMRTDKYRFTRYFDPVKIQNSGIQGEGIYELYDHVNDPDENVNIAYEPENKQLIKNLENQMKEKGFLPW
jgi:iduronate 2-sulfatase